MASIPLPALHVNPASDPLEGYAKALSVKQLMQGNQIQEVQLKNARMQNQQGEQDMQDQQVFRQAMQDPSMKGKTLGEIADVLAQSGHLSQKGYQAAKKADIDQRKELAAMTKDELENRAKGHTETQQLYNNVMNMPDEQMAQTWPEIAKQYDSIPGNKPILDPAKPMTKQQLAQFAPALGLNEAYLASEVAKRTAKAESESKTAESQQKQLSAVAQQLANAPDKNAYDAIFQDLPVRIAQNFPDPSKWSPDAKQQILQAGMTPHEQATVPVEKVEMSSWLQQNPGKTPADYERWKASGTTTTSDELGFRTNSSKSLPPVTSASPKVSSGASPKVRQAAVPDSPEALQKMTPDQRRESTVDLIGNYKMNPTLVSRMLNNHPGLMAEVQQKYPDWDQTTYNAKNKEVSYMTSGKGGQQLTAFNTAITHLSTLERLSGDLNNGDIRVFNKAAQEFAKQTGSPAPANFAAAKNAMAGEVASALKASGATDQEIGKVSDTFDSAQSPQQLKGAIQTYRELLNGKRDQLRKQFEGGKEGKPNFGDGQQHAPGANANLPEGQTGTGSDGRKYIVKGGVWVPQ
jgi:hypothetical protein